MYINRTVDAHAHVDSLTHLQPESWYNFTTQGSRHRDVDYQLTYTDFHIGNRQIKINFLCINDILSFI